jgi:mannose-6-phosphate isomerase-like protein (cupin superfamily)
MAADEIRRVVTTHDKTGKAIVMFDGPSPHKVVRPVTNLTSRVMWSAASTPADMTVTSDQALAKVGIAPPPGGSVFRIVDFPPVGKEVDGLGNDYMNKTIGHGPDHGPSKFREPTHPFMHRTNSLDYAIVMSGEIDMKLDDSEVHAKAGDVIIQQGTNHAWINRGKETCRIAFVLIDAKEP